MSYVINEIWASSTNYGATRPTSNIKYIVIHYTGNNGDTAENNGKYFQGAHRRASAHYFVDSDSIVHSVPDNRIAWSVGGNKYHNAGGRLYGIARNANTLNIELCDDTKDNTIYPSNATIENALNLVRELMKKYGVSESNVIRHYDVNGKLCPSYWVDNSRWENEFHSKISHSSTSSTTSAPTPYRVRKSWSDVKSQTGAYKDISNAKRECPNGYSVFDSNGNVVHTNGTIQATNTAPTVTVKPSAPASPSSTTSKYYLANAKVRGWQSAMNKGFDLKGNNKLVVDGKFGEASQSCASSHNMSARQTHNCITAINWLRKTLHDTYRFTKLPTTGKWDAYLTTCVKVFQKNRGLTQDGCVGLVTTYYLLKG